MVALDALACLVVLSMLRQRARWKSHPALLSAPRWLYPWLAERGSLTARIMARCHAFALSIVREAYARPFPDERPLLGLPWAQYAWVREVLLHADGEPVVFAHSILLPKDTRGAWHRARAIGARPLGAALFADPSITRGPLTCARIHPDHPLGRRISKVIGAVYGDLWARRSLFLHRGRPLVVTEVFLPAIERLG
ncbi:MAG: chorismate lyase [Rhodocyclaceae bacterium]|nr:chorismate lyase [Rhodocyclaceae bacterium]